MNRLLSVACLAFALASATLSARAALFEKPSGPVVQRNVELAAESAIQNWIASLDGAPRFDTIANVGILPLGGDGLYFTTTLSDTLSRSGKLRVVILRGAAWDAIEDELARQDPDGGWGDIMDKASIAWTENRGVYELPETTLGADALLMGQVRSIDTDWLRARVRLNLRLIKVDTREVIAGGVMEGESVLSWRDAAIYYKTEIAIVLGALIVLLWIRATLRRFGRNMRRPR